MYMTEREPRPFIPKPPPEPVEPLTTGWKKFFYSRPNALDFATLWGIEDKHVISNELRGALSKLQDSQKFDVGAFVWKQNGAVVLADRETRNNIDATGRSERIVAGHIRQAPTDQLIMGLLTYVAYLNHGKMIHPSSFDTLPLEPMITAAESSISPSLLKHITDPAKISELLATTDPDYKENIKYTLAIGFDQLADGAHNRITLPEGTKDERHFQRNALFLAVLEGIVGNAPLVCVPNAPTPEPFPASGENGIIVSFAGEITPYFEAKTALGKWLEDKLTAPNGFVEIRQQLNRLPDNLAGAKLVERLAAAYPDDTTLQTLLRRQREAAEAKAAAQKEQVEKTWRDLLDKHKQLTIKVNAYEADRFRLFSSTPEKVKAALVLPKEMIERRESYKIVGLINVLEEYCRQKNIR